MEPSGSRMSLTVTLTPPLKPNMSPTLPNSVLEAYRSNTLAFCVGSGLSLSHDVQGNFPKWQQLPLRLLDACKRLNVLDVKHIQSKRNYFNVRMSLENMLAELGSLRTALGRNYQEALNDIFRPKNAAPGMVHRTLCQLEVRTLLTTNYDALIEKVRETPHRQVYTWKESTLALSDLQSDRKILFKIHGTAERHDTVVMTEREYHEVRSDQQYRAVLSYLFQAHTFLFLGYGLNDPLDLDLVLKWNAEVFHSAARRHYALLRDARNEDQDRYLREYNVQVISYDDHTRLPEILGELRLAGSTDPGNKPERSSAPPARTTLPPDLLSTNQHSKSLHISESHPPAQVQKPSFHSRDQIFISYSHQDSKWLKRLETHLKPRIRNGNLNVWNDRRIKPGSDWRKEVNQALARAKVAVLLVSPDFLASDFIAKNELPPLLEAAEQGGVKILWVLLRYASYKAAKLDKYQAILDPAQPLNMRHHAHVDKAMEEICDAISQAFSD